VSLRNKILILVCKQFSSWESVNLTEYITTGVTFSFFQIDIVCFGLMSAFVTSTERKSLG